MQFAPIIVWKIIIKLFDLSGTKHRWSLFFIICIKLWNKILPIHLLVDGLFDLPIHSTTHLHGHSRTVLSRVDSNDSV